MSGGDIGVVVWLGGVFVVGCIAVEFRREIDEHEWLSLFSVVIILFWPLAIGVFGALGLVWLASWTVRGPIRLTRWWLERRAVERASVRCADSKAVPRAWTVRR